MTVINNANTYLPPVIQIPSALEITAISQSNPMIVTTSTNTDQSNVYIPGQAVRFNIPVTYGMWQLTNITSVIAAVNGNQLTFNIDSTGFDAFVPPSSGQLQPATLAPSGSRNLQYTNGTSLSVPFQSLNNIGN
jgi:hypothetical protein